MISGSCIDKSVQVLPNLHAAAACVSGASSHAKSTMLIYNARVPTQHFPSL